MTITLPESVAEFVQKEASAGKFRSTDDYVASLIQEEKERKARERVDDLLRQGLRSGPPREMTAEVWEEVRREGKRLLAEGAS